jgi:plasmid stability protein
MAQLLVRNLEDEVVEALQRRAAERNHSAEAEHREILRAALLPRQDFKAFLLSMPNVGEDADFERDRSAQALARDVDL